MKTETPISPLRRKARRIIHQVIEDHVLGPVQCLPHGDVLELRAKLRESYPWGERKYWPYKVWCQEVRAALGYPVRPDRRQRRPRAHRNLLPADVMPSMRDWARARGLICDPPAG